VRRNGDGIFLSILFIAFSERIIGAAALQRKPPAEATLAGAVR
jgi:hypothetical protein